MRHHKEVDVLGGAVLTFDQNAKAKRVITQPIRDEMIKFNLLFYCCLSHPTLMIRASTA